MATEANESTGSRKADDVSDSSSASDSDGDTSGDEAAAQKIEWLATTRARRSTAGNRMKAMLANEEPAAVDSDLELLFAEDEDDAGFTDVENDASDVQMDSSSDDEDQQEGGDDLEGEKELERQAKEKRKRKANEAIPARFRKKVRIEQPAADSASVSSAAPQGQQHKPRPKKKSERLSWLPTAADMPTRASERRTTKMSKEQLHQKMVKDEIRRKKQIEAMERKAAKLEAMKKPPMTQADRLAEAASVEKRNAKSLNRWEVAEKQREEERLRKIAALNSRKLDGPVVTFWSGIQELAEGQLKHVGNLVSIEEKAPRKKRQSVAATLAAQQLETSKPPSPTTPANAGANAVDSPATGAPGVKSGAPETPIVDQAVPSQPLEQPQQAQPPPPPAPTTQEGPPAQPLASQEAPAEISTQKQSGAVPSQGLMAPPPGPSSMPWTDSKQPSPPVLAASVLAPPMLGVQPPVLSTGFATPSVNPNVLAAPNTIQTPSKSSLGVAEPVLNPLASQTNQATPVPVPVPAPRPAPPKLTTNTPSQPDQGRSISKAPDTPHQATPSEPPREGKVTRSAIILQNFDEDAIKDKQVQTQILFGRKMNRLAKPAQAALCVITNHPARYRDPKTGLPFYNSHAYKEIQRTLRGDYKFSALAGAYVGSTKYAARGVPERFLDPTKPRSTPVTKPSEPGQGEMDGEVKQQDFTEQPQPTMPLPVVDARLEPTPAPAPAPAPVRKQKATAARRVSTPKAGQPVPPQGRPQHQSPVAGPAFSPSPPINQSQVPARYPTPASGPVFAPPAGPAQARTNTQSPAPVTGAVFAPITSGPPHTQSQFRPHIPATTGAVFAPIQGPSGAPAQPPFPAPASTPSFMPHAPKQGYTPLPPPGPGFIPPVLGQTQAAQAQAPPVRSSPPGPVTNAVFAPPLSGQPQIPARPQGTLSADGSPSGQLHSPVASSKGPVFFPPNNRPPHHPPTLPGSAEEAIASVRSNRVATPPVPPPPPQPPQGP